MSVCHVGLCRSTSGGLYINDSGHPHICTDISGDAELARDGHWISGRGRDRRAHGASYGRSRVGGRCILPITVFRLRHVGNYPEVLP